MENHVDQSTNGRKEFSIYKTKCNFESVRFFHRITRAGFRLESAKIRMSGLILWTTHLDSPFQLNSAHRWRSKPTRQ